MPLFTFSFNWDRQNNRMNRFTILLLGTVLVMLSATEALSRLGFDRISKVQRRQLSERRTLLSIRDTPSSTTRHIAVLGNSLMLDGVDVPLLEEKLQTAAAPVPYLVLATEYYDWLFGLKRLFAEGARPRFVLLGLSPNQLASPRSHGDYSAQYLFEASDLVEIARKTHMDATTATGFFLSKVSKFYGTREITRSFILNAVLPSVSQLFQAKLTNVHPPEVPATTLRALATQRLSAVNELCRANGSQFILVIPPTDQKGSDTISAVGRDLGIPVLVPVPDRVLDSSFYQADGFHLNEMGAQIFTLQLATELTQELPKMLPN
jgi:hypothetical protein